MTEVGWEKPEFTDPGTSPDVVTRFETLYDRHHQQVLALAYVMSGRWDVAEDVTQDAFIKLLDALRADGLDNPAGWVRTVAVNLSRSRLRRATSELRALARLRGRRHEHSTQDSEVLEAEAFWSVVRTLPKRQAQAIALHYLEDRPVREVARLMDIAEGTAKALLHQGRGRLATRLAAPSSSLTGASTTNISPEESR